MSEPLRLVQQAAQPIEFRCPICDSVHAAYIFGASQFQISRCEGCALTFSKSLTRAIDPSSATQSPTIRVSSRNERDHASLLASLDAVMVDGPVLVVANPDAKLVPLLRRGGTEVGRLAAEDDFEPGDWGETYRAAIVSNALMRVANPCATLTKIRKHLAPGAPFVLSVPSTARLMGRNWHEWQAANRWYFSRETLNLMLLSAGFEHVWFRPERRSYSSTG